ncbi:hypothetical protein KUCAC02_007349, partial [Chaenocephalus aceratus]
EKAAPHRTAHTYPLLPPPPLSPVTPPPLSPVTRNQQPQGAEASRVFEFDQTQGFQGMINGIRRLRWMGKERRAELSRPKETVHLNVHNLLSEAHSWLTHCSPVAPQRNSPGETDRKKSFYPGRIQWPGQKHRLVKASQRERDLQ